MDPHPSEVIPPFQGLVVGGPGIPGRCPGLFHHAPSGLKTPATRIRYPPAHDGAIAHASRLLKILLNDPLRLPLVRLADVALEADLLRLRLVHRERLLVADLRLPALH